MKLYLGRWFDIPTYVNPGHLFLLSFLGISLISSPSLIQSYGESPIFPVLIILLLLDISILMHEFSHALVMKLFSVPVKSVELIMFGAIANSENPFKNPKEQFLIAIAGPAMSFSIASALYIFLKVSGATFWAGTILDFIMFTNVVIGIFNSLPAFPLDGGHMLGAAIWKVTGNQVKALRISCILGLIFGVLFFIVGFITAQIFNMLIAGFIVFLNVAMLRLSTEQMKEMLKHHT